MWDIEMTANEVISLKYGRSGNLVNGCSLIVRGEDMYEPIELTYFVSVYE